MPTEAGADWRSRASGLLLLLLGGALVLMALPRVAGAFLLQAAEGARHAVAAGEASVPEGLATALARTDSSLAWRDAPEGHLLRGRLADQRAKEAADAEARAWTRQAREAYRAALARSPARHRAWFALARAEGKQGDAHALGEALRLSWRTGFHDPELAEYRLGLGLRAWSRLDERQREAAVAGPFLALWEESRGMVAATVWRTGTVDAARALLADRPRTLARLEALLALLDQHPPSR